MRLLPAWARSCRILASCVALVIGGCGTEQADQGSLVAVVPPPPVTVQNVSYVTQVEPPAVREATESAPEPAVAIAAPSAVRPAAPGCAPADAACFEAACRRGSAHACEARGNLYQAADDLRALGFYRWAIGGYERQCDHGDAGACDDFERMSAPGYGAHTYRAPPDCAAGEEMTPAGCIADRAASGPVGTTVVVNGHHNVVQVFGGAAKVVGRTGKKTKNGDAP